MPMGQLPPLGIEYSLVTTPEVFTRPILLPPSENQRAPSGPVMMKTETSLAGYSVMVPEVVTRPTSPARSGRVAYDQRTPGSARRDAFGIAARCRDRVLRDRTVCGADLDGDGRTLVFVVLARDRDRAGSRPDGRYRKRRAEHVLVAVVVAVTMDVAMLCIRGVVLNLGGRHARRGDGGARDVGRTRIHHVRIFGRRGERLRRAAQDKCQRTRRDGDLRRFDLFLFRLDCDRFPLRGLNCTGGRWRRPDRRT